MRLKGGVRGSLMPRSEVLHRPEQKFGSSFPFHAHRCPPLGPQHLGPEPVPSLETHLKSEQVKGRPNGWRYVSRKEEIQWKSDGRKREWKISSMEGEGQGDGHQYGRKARAPEPIPIGGKLN